MPGTGGVPPRDLLVITDPQLGARRRRMAALVTLLGVLGAVLAEFVLLTAVYHSDDGVDEAYRTWTGLDGAVTGWRPGDSTDGVRRALETVVGDRPDELTDAVAGRATDWYADPSPARFADLREATQALGEHLADQQAGADRQAAAIHATLLVTLSIGWFFWFRRVVRHQRRLQRSLTEAKATVSSERRLTALVRNAADVVLVVETDGTVSYASPSTRRVLGRSAEEVIGGPVTDLVGTAEAERLAGLLSNGAPGDQSVVLDSTHLDGRRLVLEVNLTNLLADEAVNGWVLTIRDITERIVLLDELAHQAAHDPLTGLANRAILSDRLAHALRRRSGTPAPVVVLFMDLDDFKFVNDSLGRAAGDVVLGEIARRIAVTVREGDTPVRLGGDEFAVLMEDSDLETGHEVAAALLARLSEPMRAGDAELRVRVSVGLAAVLPGSTSAEEALRAAEVAMSFAKERGKGTVAVYDADLHASALRVVETRSELSRAVPQGELVLHYQPTYHLGTGRIDGFEALLRWQHPTRGLLAPGEFVDIAEQSGLIVPIGRWVLDEACRAAVTSLTHERCTPVMAVNISTRQLVEASFEDDVMRSLSESGLEASRLVLEITESSLLDGRDEVIDSLTRLHSLGIRFAIDDFGTGYSSLSYLADLPVDVLKIDKSFVDQVCSGGSSLAEAILSISSSLHLVTVAEGVEAREQAEWLRRYGCEVGQGYVFSRPVPLAEARRMVLADAPVPWLASAPESAAAG